MPVLKSYDPSSAARSTDATMRRQRRWAIASVLFSGLLNALTFAGRLPIRHGALYGLLLVVNAYGWGVSSGRLTERRLNRVVFPEIDAPERFDPTKGERSTGGRPPT